MATFRVDLSDQEVDLSASLETHISQEAGVRRVRAELCIAGSSTLLSEVGLRRLARAATCMADEIAATELALAKAATP